MFGLGRKKDAEKTGTNATEEEFQFDFEEDDQLPFDDEGFDELEEPPAGGFRQALSQRKVLLSLLLLLLALGGAGYYYLSSSPEPPPSTPVKTKVKVKPAQPAPAAAPAVAAKPVAAPPAETPAAAPAAAPAVAVKPVAAPPAATPAAAPAVAAKPVAAVPKASRQPYIVNVGAFLDQDRQRDVEKKIRRLGYTPKVETTYSMVPMTRLLLGIYDNPAAAEARRKELATSIPGAFILKQGADVVLYAGSFQSLDQARSFADQLYRQGILADEETVSLRMPLKKFSFGPFSSRAEADKAVKRAVSAGLTAQVVKR